MCHLWSHCTCPWPSKCSITVTHGDQNPAGRFSPLCCVNPGRSAETRKCWDSTSCQHRNYTVLFSFPLTKMYTLKTTFDLTFAKKIQIRTFNLVLYSGILLLPGCHKITVSLFTFPSASRRTLVWGGKAQSMLSDKHVLPTEEKEHVDKESKRDRADQIHIYIYNSQIYFQKLTHTSVGIFHSRAAETLHLKTKHLPEQSAWHVHYTILCLLWRTVIAKVASKSHWRMHFFFYFLKWELATLSVVYLATLKKVYWLGLCMPDSTVSYLSPS